MRLLRAPFGGADQGAVERDAIVTALGAAANCTLRSEGWAGLEAAGARLGTTSMALADPVGGALAAEETLVAEVEALAGAMDAEERRHAREASAWRAELHGLSEGLRGVRARAAADVHLARDEAGGWAAAAGAGAAGKRRAAAAAAAACATAAARESSAHDTSTGLLHGEREALETVGARWREREAADAEALGAELGLALTARATQASELAALRARATTASGEVGARAECARVVLVDEASRAAALAARDAAATLLQGQVGAAFAEIHAAAAALAAAGVPKGGKGKGK